MIGKKGGMMGKKGGKSRDCPTIPAPGLLIEAHEVPPQARSLDWDSPSEVKTTHTQSPEIYDNSSSVESQKTMVVPFGALSAQLHETFDNSALANVVFEVGGSKIYAIKSILCLGSPYFATKAGMVVFETETFSEGSTATVGSPTVVEIGGSRYRTFYCILFFLYTGHIKFAKPFAFDQGYEDYERKLSEQDNTE
ncbi:hypothetical protein BT69DRAFT_1293035 [Atractiella rhizophila]|nr:hypothetical protein BT69DRAFT_1293035 [Atractiella rhizophila]